MSDVTETFCSLFKLLIAKPKEGRSKWKQQQNFRRAVASEVLHSPLSCVFNKERITNLVILLEACTFLHVSSAPRGSLTVQEHRPGRRLVHGRVEDAAVREALTWLLTMRRQEPNLPKAEPMTHAARYSLLQNFHHTKYADIFNALLKQSDNMAMSKTF